MKNSANQQRYTESPVKKRLKYSSSMIDLSTTKSRKKKKQHNNSYNSHSTDNNTKMGYGKNEANHKSENRNATKNRKYRKFNNSLWQTPKKAPI